MTLEHYCEDLAKRARHAGRLLAIASPRAKSTFLSELSDGLTSAQTQILESNARDMDSAVTLGLLPAQLDRLRLTPDRIRAMADGVRQVMALPEPVGRVLSSTVQPSGLRIDKISVPLGVILFIYESRPNVTVDAAALAVKSGNAIILRGGKEAVHSNQALARVVSESLTKAGFHPDAVQLVDTPDRAAVDHLLHLEKYIDLAIPRGGYDLIMRVVREARMPVMKHFQGICHVYVETSADQKMARDIVVNAKCSRPGVCNAAECLLVDEAIAGQFLPEVATALIERGVELRGCPRTCEIVPHASPVTLKDFATEYLALVMSVKVVASIEEAIGHVAQFGTGHSEAIITKSLSAARHFTNVVDAAAVFVNASTRFHDGYEFGLGAEIGISTDKFHARGPCGLNELTSYKYVVYGDGQTRG